MEPMSDYFSMMKEEIEDDSLGEAEVVGGEKNKKHENRRQKRRAEGKGRNMKPSHDLGQEETRPIAEEFGKNHSPENAEKREDNFGGKEKLLQGIERLKEYTVNRAKELRERGINVDDVGRINPLAFNSDLKSTAAYHSRRVKEIEHGFEDGGGDRKMKEMSECMEMLVTALLSHILGDDYVVCRSSKYDDYVNKSDNVVIRLRDGRVIGAIDDAIRSAARFKPESLDLFAEKKTVVEEKNAAGGTTIRYCYGKESENDPGLSEKEQIGVPLFYLGLTFRELIDGLSEFGAPGERPESHQKILDKIFSSLNNQMPILKGMGFDVFSFETDFIEIAEIKNIDVKSESGCYVEYGEKQNLNPGSRILTMKERWKSLAMMQKQNKQN